MLRPRTAIAAWFLTFLWAKLRLVPNVLASTPPLPISGICITDTPDETCGISTTTDSCTKFAKSLYWSGTCCSLSDTADGGCKLTVDGPGSSCTSLDVSEQSSFSVVISTNNKGTCPKSDYQVLDPPAPSQYKVCLAASFAECASHCTQYNNLGKTFQKCHDKTPAIATSCLSTGAITCNDAKGVPPDVICQTLTQQRKSGNLKKGACRKLKLKCGTSAASVTC